VKLLLHACCAPCASAALLRLRDDFELTAYFFNPNIHPEEEYMLRLKEFKRLMRAERIEMIEERYEPEEWFEAVKGLEDEKEGGARCEACFRLRLEKTAKKAKEKGFDCFAASLSAGPMKNAALINKLGKEAAKKRGLAFLEEDFKKKDGFKKALAACRKHKIYRQNYCGCIFSRDNSELSRCAE
jgi:epoxyqueuosine reductase